MKPFLEIKNITMKFGSLTANEDVSFTIHDNEIVSLIGPNGAGKTTLFNCITGFYKPLAGCVVYRGRDITGMAPHEIAGRGLPVPFR